MSQKDHFKDRIVNIDFIPNSFLKDLTHKNKYTLTLITSGAFSGALNGIPIRIKAPYLLCLTNQDQLLVSQKQNVVAPTIQFDEDFLRTLRISDKHYVKSQNSSIKVGMQLFKRDNVREKSGAYKLTSEVYPKIIEKFFVAGSEVLVQSDRLWVCRIKKNLIVLLSLVDNLIKADNELPLNKALDYIYTNYSQQITLNDLTANSFSNRDTLNRCFREKYGCTAMQYLLLYRLKIAKNLLTHTGISLNEIAYAVGFSYDTYFIKQFKKKFQQTPTEYRRVSRKLAAYQ
ncbi:MULTISPECIES: helix-turn-helix domain-containing protein [Lactobacillaceae]|nr:MULTISPECIES: AraC family transcriptional regulator [Lactobacillaceae]APD02935.2 AraC family transcriptional regulator [Lactiplantibacillus plantarum]QBA81878.1 AraC family transcriptional regulator [Lactiplantibacillus plantarum]RCI90163.1 AraC family transcriptional regulator [Lactiplantibacillus plantarum]